MLNPQETIPKKRVPILFAMSFFLVSCFQEDPSGRFEGEIKDWVHEVFEASLTTQGNLCQIEVILRQLPDGLISRLTFQHPKMQEVVRPGKWKVEDGYKSIFFEDGKQPSEYFLIKKGARFAFQTKDGLSNDDGSPILMMRNEGKSRKASYPIKMFFEEEDNVRVESFGKDQVYSGTWQWGGDQIAVSVKLEEGNAEGSSITPETYKYFLHWEKGGSSDLVLEKMVIIRPFLNEDGSRRQSWMSSLIFSDRPLLRKK